MILIGYIFRRMLNRIIVLCAFISFIFGGMSYAQNTVEVFVADFHQDELRKKIESNASKLLSAINYAQEKQADIEITDAVVTESFASVLINLWEKSPFYIPDSKIIETISRLPNGRYEMRNI